MAGNIEVDPDALATAANLTENLADEVQAVFTSLQSELEVHESAGTNQPWGNDKLGKKFSTGENNDGYQSARDNLLAGLEGMANTLREFATGQRDAVTALTQADQSGL
ncbi:hypothetical protein [Nocardia sp. NPDC057353]|uniref:hypothetical protein n=1 Tax=Nocardia sp. NPDC057353 TaxID=3346104 RepID=UPI00363FF562